MNPTLKKLAIPLLRWTVGLIVLIESLRVEIDPAEIQHFAAAGLPQWFVWFSREPKSSRRFYLWRLHHHGRRLCADCYFCAGRGSAPPARAVRRRRVARLRCGCVGEHGESRLPEWPRKRMTDSELLEQFENCALPTSAFHHQDHVRLCVPLSARISGVGGPPPFLHRADEIRRPPIASPVSTTRRSPGHSYC